jgi:CRISPR-associated endonuclease/helicase Cas3
MRVLVEQSEQAARKWLEKLRLTGHINVHVLMGGVELEDWFLEPETPAILIGTQDMLLSRALNRGYAESRFHWPIDFGLLNNDCLWVFDEPQLMGSGVSTSAQLAGLRDAFGTFGLCPSIWMSATLEPSWLNTVDFRGKFPADPLHLSKEDYDIEPLRKRMTANKTLKMLDAPWSEDMKEVAKEVVANHEPGTQTLVVLNTVKRAKNLFAILQRDKKAREKRLLIHSRYRPAERQNLNRELQRKDEGSIDRIIVATQVVEAGVDISARTLITELAPWSSLVQRMGRCNRTGDDGPGEVHWINLDPDKASAPYELQDLQFALEQLAKLDGENVSPKSLDDFNRKGKIHLPFEHKHVLRRRDLIDLFDTTPDLSGNDIDIQRFVRSDEEPIAVHLFWRPFSGEPSDEIRSEREELCSAPIGEVREFLDEKREKGVSAFTWDHLDGEWKRLDARAVRPGMVLLLPSDAGGYSTTLGWHNKATEFVEPANQEPSTTIDEDAVGSDPNSITRQRALKIDEHTANVTRRLAEIAAGLSQLVPEYTSWLATAALWHDVGKAHCVFQTALRRLNEALDAQNHWAKSGKEGRLRYDRRYFRHELASALAAVQHGLPFEIAYLIAAHHGKLRLSIRSFPEESPLPDTERTTLARERFGREPLFAAGVWDLDELGPVTLSNSEVCPRTVLDLSPMQLGGDRSWTAQAIGLRDRLGPFKLAYLEALLRAADLWASKTEKEAGDA